MSFIHQLEEEPLNAILNLHQLLETCRFQEFWVNINIISIHLLIIII